jgi:ADP-ribose pyrophosphatase YjhB (NUDIX family)
VSETYCSTCGAKYPQPTTRPLTCPACATQVWANPIPVCVLLQPVRDGSRSGLLVIRRAVEPQVGRLALVGGFLEDHEDWRAGARREMREETGLEIDSGRLEPMWFASSAPRPNRVLLFSIAAELAVGDLTPMRGDGEADERGLVFGPDGLSDVFAFPLHVDAAAMYFARHGVTGPHTYVVR